MTKPKATRKKAPIAPNPMKLALDALYEEQGRVESERDELERKLEQIEDAICALEDIEV